MAHDLIGCGAHECSPEFRVAGVSHNQKIDTGLFHVVNSACAGWPTRFSAVTSTPQFFPASTASCRAVLHVVAELRVHLDRLSRNAGAHMGDAIFVRLDDGGGHELARQLLCARRRRL